jgi:hypothetical protein
MDGAACGPGGGASGSAAAQEDDGPAIGNGIPTDADLYCMIQLTPDHALARGYDRTCLIAKKLHVPATAAEKEDFCSLEGGLLVDSCTATETPVAYCAEPWRAREGVATVPFDVVRVIERGPFTPSAVAVARNVQAFCQGEPIYDTSNHHVSATCTGTLSATVDGVPKVFSSDVYCVFFTDGTRAAFAVSAGGPPEDPMMRWLVLNLFKDATGVSLKGLGMGSRGAYVEATGSSGWFNTPVDASAPRYHSQTFDPEGAAVSGAFTFGALENDEGATRVVTDGCMNVTFTLR